VKREGLLVIASALVAVFAYFAGLHAGYGFCTEARATANSAELDAAVQRAHELVKQNEQILKMLKDKGY
jgi:hypothetical protein